MLNSFPGQTDFSLFSGCSHYLLTNPPPPPTAHARAHTHTMSLDFILNLDFFSFYESRERQQREEALGGRVAALTSGGQGLLTQAQTAQATCVSSLCFLPIKLNTQWQLLSKMGIYKTWSKKHESVFVEIDHWEKSSLLPTSLGTCSCQCAFYNALTLILQIALLFSLKNQ